MPAKLALLLAILGIGMLLWRFTVRQSTASAALWLPVIWICIAGSRFVSQWLFLSSSGTSEDGSPLDAAVFSALLLAGLVVLLGRKREVVRVLRDNPLIVVLLVYGFLSIFWSDFPATSFKRYVKALGHPVMALIVATEAQPGRAFQLVIRRCAFVLIPMSIVLIKYFPEIGRYFDAWLGTMYNQGAAITKNGLGATSMVFAILFTWSLVFGGHAQTGRERRLARFVDLGALAATFWLLHQADSATSKFGFIVGASLIVALRLRFMRRQAFIWIFGLPAILTAAFASSSTLRAALIERLGRDATLTDRTFLWADILELHQSPWLGAGFEAFWLGWRRDLLWDKWWWQPLQAHNGYLEVYINQGAVGLALYILVLFALLFRLLRCVRGGSVNAVLYIALFIPILLHNITEAGFVGIAFVWTLFYCIVFASGRELPMTARAGQMPVRRPAPQVARELRASR